MSSEAGYMKAGSVCRFVPGLLATVCMALTLACSYHPPAPVEEHSTGIVKRQLNSDGSYYVRSGDTLYAIAFGYDLDPIDIAKWNNISSPFTIYPGQQLRLSGPSAGDRNDGTASAVQISAIKAPGQTTTRSVATPASATRTSPAETDPALTKSLPPASSGTSAPPVSTPAPGAADASKPATAGKPAKSIIADPDNWLWPTNGRVHRTYLAGDPARNGLDIAGQEGQPIYASSGGQVVYSGNGLIGYGELIIIKHSEKMLSAYAQNKVRLVNEGEQVSAGQKIAEMGRNPGNEQLLHFEIRVLGKPVDPLIYLPRK
jgi:lipoprotein NlpD